MSFSHELTQLLTYNALDCSTTLEIMPHVQHLIESGGYEWTDQHTRRTIEPLMYMMVRGIKVDHDALIQATHEMTGRVEKLQDELNSLCGRPLNVNSPPDCKKYFYIEKNVAPYHKKGAHGKSTITCDDRALQMLAKGTATRKGMREASLIQEIRGLLKLKGTYLEIEFDTDGRMRCSYNPRGTKFGRLSSSKTIFGTGMNMQNLPEEFKQFLVPDPGYFFAEIDKSQAEWVVVAYASGDAGMIQVLETKTDPHTHTASLMFQVSKEYIAAESEAVGHSTDPNHIAEVRKEVAKKFPNDVPNFLIRTMSMRQCGKKSNHGLNYDESHREFALQNEIPEADAKRIVDLYHRIYPGVRSWHTGIQRQLNVDRTLTNCFGRRIKLLDGWGPDLWKAAYSAIPQSTVVDLVNRALFLIYEDSSINGEILAQVHDSILLQLPLSDPDGAVDALAKCLDYMNPTMEYDGRPFHIDSDIKIGMNGRDLHVTRIENVKETVQRLAGHVCPVHE